MSRVAWFASIALILFTSLAPAHAERRVALVVGNAAYLQAGIPRLDNPVNDARGMRDALKGLGFDIVYGENLDLKGLKRAIGQFAGRVEDADVAIVYFAGHGATFDETSYVVPVDAEFASLTEVVQELVPVETLIGDLRRAKGVRIAILDACRDNGAEQDLKRRAGRGGGDRTRGLAPMKNASGLIIAYATQYGATAADDAGISGRRHSPFTAALLNNIATPGLDLTDMFRKVGRDVTAATRGGQRPEISISMYDQYVLVTAAGIGPGGSVTVVVTTETPAPPVTVTVTAKPSGDAPLTAAHERALKPKDLFRECDKCPEMVVIPAGSFTMGSPESEEGRQKEDGRPSDEGPQHEVTIARPFAVGKFHVTRDQYAAFVEENRYEPGTNGRFCSWRNPRFTQEGSHPVVCVTWDDAVAYVEWLAKKTGEPYRLLTEAEFEYAGRAKMSPGAYPRFWFGDDEKALCRYSSFCERAAATLPAGDYPPNPFGLYDMFNNAGQWTADCYHDSYVGAPADGSAWTAGGTCLGGHVVRGASWSLNRRDYRAAARRWETVSGSRIGFRVARTLRP